MLRMRDVEAISQLLGRLGKHGALAVLLRLKSSDARFSELLDGSGASKQTLSRRLRELAEEGLIVRKSFPEVPPRVEYSLTPFGRRLLGVLERLG